VASTPGTTQKIKESPQGHRGTPIKGSEERKG